MIKLSFVDYVQFILNKPYIFVIKYLCLNQKKKKLCISIHNTKKFKIDSHASGLVQVKTIGQQAVRPQRKHCFEIVSS